ncbi:VOC family protein [Saccharothrix coeruleofusca]|uniref:Biphenyl-2,3-diol 1,2-dioxygenase III n=1 Tax=Saccharothrix coeruleofusca TaxID=33919 RepID=A0A918ALS4_9PSEU|nr:VOC family protein [Saccharothrix coeruleofusca]MBP2336273.1 catechol-2,3-dioxygenase [Saccharothrix coeruleofusca]GGP54209.1 putative biphenyl-2,3-diol 1,2-dioxygenase III [Saccharothrix coeruleofusca]
MVSPAKLAHVVLRTGDLQTMIDWYVAVLDARVVHANEQLAFLTYDDEHHRVALVNAGATERPTSAHSGLEHVAFTYADLGDLLDNYQRLKAAGTTPVWSVNHGPTTSLYYADPDGNKVELQIDNFDTDEQMEAFFASGAFAANPIGVEFDPDELHARLKAGEPRSELIKQTGSPATVSQRR